MVLHDPVRTPAGPDALPRRARRLRLLAPALFALLLLAALAAIAVYSLRQPPAAGPDGPSAVPLASARIEAPFAPATLRPLTAEQAAAWNAARPGSGAMEAASSFRLVSGQGADFQRSLECLTMAVYYEAGNETDDGERAVAQVVLNRLRHPAYPKTVCGVVFDGAQRRTGCQFTFACDGALKRRPNAAGWERAQRIAASALAGEVFAPVGWATHYHANYVVPYWAASLDKVMAIGAHVFYRWTGSGGRGTAFRGVYAGNEPAVALVTPSALPEAATSETPAPPASGEVAVTDRPVLIAPRDTSAATTVALGDRRVLPRQPVTDDPATPARAVRPVLPSDGD